MGRGRQKAKQAKVARELKYASGGTDLDALAAELSSTRGTTGAEDDTYADFEDTDFDDEESDEESAN